MPISESLLKQQEQKTESYDYFDLTGQAQYFRAYTSGDNKLSSIAKKLKNFVRRYSFTKEDQALHFGEQLFNKLYQELIDPNIDSTNDKILFSQSLKHLCKKTGLIVSKDFFDKCKEILEQCDNNQIKSEIVWALAYKIKNSNEEEISQAIEIVDKLVDLIDDEINLRARSFLNEQIQQKCSHYSTSVNLEQDHSQPKLATRHFNTGHQKIVTKEQQTVKVSSKDYQSEASEICIKSLVEMLQSKKINVNASVERVPLGSFKSNRGSELGWFTTPTTYSSVRKLYLSAKEGVVIKDDDKNDYLPSSFVGDYVKMSARLSIGIAGCLFIDVMIARIFSTISVNQKLNDRAIEKLMRCVDSLDVVKGRILSINLEATSDHQNEAIRAISNVNYHPYSGGTYTYTGNDPEIITAAAKKIQGKTLQEVDTVVSSVINQIRIDAIQAIYNCALRDQAILTPNYMGKIKKCLREKDLEFNALVCKVFSLTKEGEGSEELLEANLTQLEEATKQPQSKKNESIVKDAIDYIAKQIETPDKCCRLCGDSNKMATVISRINKISLHSSTSDKIKISCRRIINSYLGHTFTQGLDELSLNGCCEILFDQKTSKDLKEEAFKSILWSAEKSKKLPLSIVGLLTIKMSELNDTNVNLMLMVFRSICAQSPISNLEQISAKLTSNFVIITDAESEITFEERSKENAHCTSISAIAAVVCYESLEKDSEKDSQIEITPGMVKNFLLGLESVDKQTRILSVKLLNTVAKRCTIDEIDLLGLIKHLHDNVPDVLVYSTLAYVNSLSKLSQASNKPLLSGHVEALVSVYAFADLKLGSDNFTETVNSGILSTLLSEAKKATSFDESVFEVFDRILFLGENNLPQVVEILQAAVVGRKLSIPASTIMGLEKGLAVPELNVQILEVLKGVIRNGQPVKEQTLQIFIDNLYLSPDDALREESFDLLNQADSNQDLSDQIFAFLELERAGKCIADPTKSDAAKSKAISYLNQSTDEGGKLSISNFKVLAGRTIDLEVLSVLVNVSRNRQIIPGYLIQELVDGFNPTKLGSQSQNIQLLDILLNIIQNSQEIPCELWSKLEQALDLDDKQIFEQVVFMFTTLAPTDKKLSNDVITKILNKLLLTNDWSLKQEVLILLVSAIKAKDQGTNPLQNLSEQSIEALLQKTISEDCTPALKAVIDEILNRANLSEVQQAMLKLSQTVSDQELIDQIAALPSGGLMLKRNFKQIGAILDSSSSHATRAIAALINYLKHPEGSIPDELMNKVANFLRKISAKSKDEAAQESSANDEDEVIKQLCCDLIINIIKAGHRLTEPMVVAILLVNTVNKGLKNRVILALQDNQQSIPDGIKLFFKFDEPQTLNPQPSNPPTMFAQFLQMLSPKSRDHQERVDNLGQLLLEFKSTFQHANPELRDLIIEKLIGLAKSDSQNTEEFAKSFAFILEHDDAKYAANEVVIAKIEQAILSTRSIAVWSAYNKIIKSQKRLNSAVIDRIVDLLPKSNRLNSSELYLTMVECIVSAAEVGKISANALKVLSANLHSSNHKLRLLSFRGLKAAAGKDYSKLEEFKKWCMEIFDQFSQDIGVKIKVTDQDGSIRPKFLELLDTLVLLKHKDKVIEQIKKLGLEQENWGRLVWWWNRELLLLDLLTEASILEKLSFCRSWFEVEAYFSSQNPEYSNVILKLLHEQQSNNKLSFSALGDVVKLLLKVNFESARKVLANSSASHVDLKLIWIKQLISERMVNKESGVPNELIYTISSKFNLDLIEQLLSSIKEIDDLQKFQALLDFVYSNKIEISDICIQNATLDHLTRSLELKLLGDQLFSKGMSDSHEMVVIFNSLLENGWSFEQLNQICCKAHDATQADFLTEQARKQNLILVLKLLVPYKVSALNHDRICQVLDKVGHESWFTAVNKMVIENLFPTKKGKIKSSNELIEELKRDNPNNHSLQLWIEQQSQLNSIEAVKQKEKEEYSAFGPKEIENWSKKVQANRTCFNDPNFLIEALAVIKRACFLSAGIHLNDAQILSCLVALNSSEKQGKLLQVLTGEGKSIIVSVLAIVNALKGNKVDIITSSPVLAERDAKEQASLYKMFGFSTSDNSDKSMYFYGAKSCYKAEIVYGTSSQFRFDILRDEYSGLNTLGGRKLDVAIIDEVDSMLIDDGAEIARLAATIPGMDQLQPIYHLIWGRLLEIQERIVEINGKIYLFQGKISYKSGRIELEYLENAQDEHTKIITDLKEYVKSGVDISNIGQVIEEDIEIFAKENLARYIRELLDKRVVIVPNNLKEFVGTQMLKWIDNAITAFNYQENVHYIVQDGLIKPVDYATTGVVQNSTSWSDGLHQFLQLKHGLKLNSENFTTNFLSNMGYFKRYAATLGVSGTLGSDNAKQALSEVYNVDHAVISPLRAKQYFELPTIVADQEKSWIEEICSSAKKESKKGRGTLIICETIEHAQTIAQKLRKESSSIKLYTHNNNGQEQEIEKINSGEIIIATNLAGRGTNIKTDDTIESNGGLHVIATFMPSNQRVEEQAFGRTSRQGNRGTGQMILNALQLNYKYGTVDYKEAKALRDQIESKQLKKLQQEELKVIATKDQLFKRFCILLQQIRLDIREVGFAWIEEINSSCY